MTMISTRPDEIGEIASAAIREVVTRAVAGDNVSTYLEGDSPISWSSLSEAGWDSVGLDADTTLRDLVEVAIAWGDRLIALPLLPTIVIRRHVEPAESVPGPLSISVATATCAPGRGVVPYGQITGGSLLVDAEQGKIEPMPDGDPSDFDPASRALVVPTVSSLTLNFADEMRALWAGEAAGIARRTVADAVGFASAREQFGRPIGSFQAVKHHLANAHVHAEQAETAAIWTSIESSRSTPVADYAIASAIRSVELAIQVHGGLGFTWELGLHFSLRHLQQLREYAAGLGRA